MPFAIVPEQNLLLPDLGAFGGHLPPSEIPPQINKKVPPIGQRNRPHPRVLFENA